MAVQGPGKILPGRAARDGEPVQILILAVLEIVGAGHPERPVRRFEVQVHIDMGDVGLGLIEPCGMIFLPILFPPLFDGAALESPIHLAPQRQPQSHGDDDQGGKRQQRATALGNGQSRTHAVALPPRKETHGRPGERHGERQDQQAVEDEGRAIEVERPQVAPGDRRAPFPAADQRPVPHPAHVVAGKGEHRDDHGRQADAIGGVAAAGDHQHSGDEGTPDDERRRQEEAPDEKERPQVHPDAALAGDGDRGREHSRRHRHQPHHAEGQRLARHHRPGGHRRGVEHRPDARRALPLQGFDGVEKE